MTAVFARAAFVRYSVQLPNGDGAPIGSGARRLRKGCIQMCTHQCNASLRHWQVAVRETSSVIRVFAHMCYNVGCYSSKTTRSVTSTRAVSNHVADGGLTMATAYSTSHLGIGKDPLPPYFDKIPAHIFNEFVDLYLHRLNTASAVKVCMVVMQMQGDNPDPITLSRTQLCEMTGLSEPAVTAGVRHAVEIGALQVFDSDVRTHGYVYLICAENGACKIGISYSHPSRRLGELQTGSPLELTLEFWFEAGDPFEVEQQLHARFRSKHIRREWFALDEDDIAYIKGLAQ